MSGLTRTTRQEDAMKNRMSRRNLSGLVGMMVAAALLGACANEAATFGPLDETSPGNRADAVVCGDERVMTYDIVDGAWAQSHIERTVRVDGSEVLYGRTEIGGAEGAPVRAIVIEEVEIDAGGRLVSADISLVSGEEGAEVEKRVRFDPVKGSIRIDGPSGTNVWSAPDDAPWVYAPLAADGPQAVPVATPVAAWVTLRAIEASPNARVIDGDGLWTNLTPADQLVVEDGASRFVVLGDDVIEANGDFIASMWLNSLAVAPAAREGAPRVEGFKLAQPSR
jgi:hypothetical protein